MKLRNTIMVDLEYQKHENLSAAFIMLAPQPLGLQNSHKTLRSTPESLSDILRIGRLSDLTSGLLFLTCHLPAKYYH